MMVENSPETRARAAYEKPALVRVRLDVKASTLGVNCWNSINQTTTQDNGCLLPSPTCALV